MANDKNYSFHIDTYTPETIPMERLAVYLHELAILLGETKSVHFVKLVEGTTQIVHRVEREAVPRVEARLRRVKNRDATQEALRAYDTINDYLADDAANAVLKEVGDGAQIIDFPGAAELVEPEFGPFNQSGTIDGVVIKVGGKREKVPVHLETRDGAGIGCVVTRALAKDLAKNLFGGELRLTGTGRWFRDKYGKWVLRAFDATSFEHLDTKSLSELAADLSAVDGAGWKTIKDPWAALAEIRSGDGND
mgnify:CR=1 FL=1